MVQSSAAGDVSWGWRMIGGGPSLLEYRVGSKQSKEQGIWEYPPGLKGVSLAVLLWMYVWSRVSSPVRQDDSVGTRGRQEDLQASEAKTRGLTERALII